MSTVADYIGRTYDVMAFQGATAAGVDVPLTGVLADESSGGTICTGIQKLAQCWLLEFLTELGSVPYEAGAGTEFLTTCRSGAIQTETDIYVAFGFAAARVARNLQAVETDETPTDEQLQDAELLNVILAPGQISLRVTITSVAGAAREVILPIPVTP